MNSKSDRDLLPTYESSTSDGSKVSYVVNLVQCEPAGLNRRGKVTARKPIEILRDLVNIPTAATYEQLRALLFERVDSRFSICCKANEMRGGVFLRCPGAAEESIPITDDSCWEAGRRLLNGSPGRSTLEMWWANVPVGWSSEKQCEENRQEQGPQNYQNKSPWATREAYFVRFVHCKPAHIKDGWEYGKNLIESSTKAIIIPKGATRQQILALLTEHVVFGLAGCRKPWINMVVVARGPAAGERAARVMDWDNQWEAWRNLLDESHRMLTLEVWWAKVPVGWNGRPKELKGVS